MAGNRQQIIWHIVPGQEHVIAFLGDLTEVDDSDSVKCNRRRSVYALPGPEGHPGVYVKHNYPAGIRDQVKRLWRCKARQEFESGRALAAAGIPVVRMLAWGRRGQDSYLVTEAVPDAMEFGEAWETGRDDPARRRLLLTSLGALLRQLMAHRVRAWDMHAGNVLVHGHAPEQSSLCLVDVYGMRISRRLSLRHVDALFDWMGPLLRQLSDDEAEELLSRALPPSFGESPGGMVRRILARQHVLARSRWPGRRGRLLRHSSLCLRIENEAGSWFLRRPFPVATGAAALAAHREAVGGSADIVKRDTKRRLSRVSVGDETYVVKEFLRPRPLWIWRSDCRNWLNAYRLGLHSVPCARVHAWLRGHDGHGYIIMADAGEISLARRMAESTGARDRRPFLEAAAGLVAQLHGGGMFHRDLKLTNFIIGGSEPGAGTRLQLVDLESVRFQRSVCFRQRVRNLCQMLESCRAAAPAHEVARFLVRYADMVGLGRADRRRLRHEVDVFLRQLTRPEDGGANGRRG